MEKEIKKLNKELEYDDLTELFDWDLDHWLKQMSDITDGQVKRFIALKLLFSTGRDKDGNELSKEDQRQAFRDLVDMLDWFGIKRLNNIKY